MSDDYAKRIAAENTLGLRELELEAQLRRAQGDAIDHTVDRTHAKLRACVYRNAALAEQLLDVEASRLELEARVEQLGQTLVAQSLVTLKLEDQLETARGIAARLEAECASCTNRGEHELDELLDDELAAAVERHPAGRLLGIADGLIGGDA